MWRLVVIGVGFGLAACSEFGPRVYTAHPYRAGQGCLAPSIPIGIVRAEELASSCASVCLFLDETLYVSDVCAPYPARALPAPEGSADCARALALRAAEAWCEAPPPQLSDAGALDGAPADSQAPEP
jgi:hypothetical protein